MAETLGVGNAVDACLDFIAAEKEAVVAAAKKRFSSPETLGVTSLSPPVDWTLAVQRLAAWPRRGGGVAVATQHPMPLSSPRGGNEATESSPPSPPLPQGFECDRQFFGLRRARDDTRGAAAGIERSTQCPDYESGDDVSVHRSATWRRRKRVSRRSTRNALEGSRCFRSESQQTSPRPPPPPPTWPRKEACVEPTATCSDDGARDGQVGSWREQRSGDRPKHVAPCATAEARDCQKAAHRERAAPPLPGGDFPVRGKMEGEARTSSSGSDDGVDQQVSVEEEGRDDDGSELSGDYTLRDDPNREPGGGGGGDGGGIGERRCCCRVSNDVNRGCCRNDEGSTRTLKAPQPGISRTISSARTAACCITRGAVQVATTVKATTRVGQQSSGHPSDRWPCASFESDPSSVRHHANEEPTSPQRWRSHSTSYYDTEGDSGYDGEGDVDEVRSDPRQHSVQSSSEGARPVGVSTRHESEGAADGDDGEQDDEISCALARKRALLRVRLARQRHELATAVVDANERGLRAERRRRREEKLAALLANARRDGGAGVGVDVGGCSSNQGTGGGQLVRGRSYNEERGERRGVGYLMLVGYSWGENRANG